MLYERFELLEKSEREKVIIREYNTREIKVFRKSKRP